MPTPTAEPSLRGHHSVLVAAAAAYTGDLLGAIDAGDAQAFGAAHGTLAAWCQFELVPALVALERELYPLATGRTELLARCLVGSHRVVAGLVDSINAASDAARLAGDASALTVLVRTTLASVDELLVPALACDGESSDAGASHDALAQAVAQVPRTAAAMSAEYAAAVQQDADAAHARAASGCGGGCCGGGASTDAGACEPGGCGGSGCGGICGTAADDARTQDERDAARAAVTVTRID